MRIDIIIPTQNRPHLLSPCLQSLFDATKQSVGQIDFRILVCASGQHEPTLQLLKASQSRSAILNFWQVPEPLSAAAARNHVLPFVDSDWLFFIDDDAGVDRLFFQRFMDSLTLNPDASVIGGPNLTPAHSTILQHAIGATLASRFGSFVSSARYRPRRRLRQCGEETLILCNLFIKREKMQRLQFSEALVCNEENWLLQDLTRRGCLLIYEPSLCVWHERRNGIEGFATQIHKYGVGRGQNLRERPYTLRTFHVLPSLCLVFTTFALVASPWWPVLLKIWLILLMFYSLAWITAITRLRTAVEKRARVRIFGALLFPLIHVSYGIGVLRGLMRPVDPHGHVT